MRNKQHSKNLTGEYQSENHTHGQQPEAVKLEHLPEGLTLEYLPAGLTLRDDSGLSLGADFSRMIPRIRKSNLNRELIVRAAKITDFMDIHCTKADCDSNGPAHFASDYVPIVYDGTAGFGEDSLLLAAAGFNVRLYEYDPVIAALLSDALSRAGEIPELRDIMCRMKLFEEDFIAAMGKEKITPDIIYLDPMFPERTKSGLVKKKFQLLKKLERPCANEDQLVSASLAAKPRKIIIKRPLKAPCLGGIKPNYSISGKTIRYDCLVLSQMQH